MLGVVNTMKAAALKGVSSSRLQIQSQMMGTMLLNGSQNSTMMGVRFFARATPMIEKDTLKEYENMADKYSKAFERPNKYAPRDNLENRFYKRDYNSVRDRFKNNDGDSYRGESNSFQRRDRRDSFEDRSYRKRDINIDDVPSPEWDVEALKEKVKLFPTASEPPSATAVQETKTFFEEHHIRTSESVNKISPYYKFEQTPFSPSIKNILETKGFTEPTAVQSLGWSLLFNNRDTIGIAQTGSGKTLSFMLPAIEHIKLQGVNSFSTDRIARPKALVLAPTRELAQQIHNESFPFLRAARMKSGVVYGGTQKSFQIRDLEGNPSVIIGTPGRIIDLLSSNFLKFENVSYLVFDEADRMLDMGFEPQIRQILRFVPPVRHTVMWSATWPKEVVGLAKSFLKPDAVTFSIGSRDLAANKDIEQKFVFCQEHEKQSRLTAFLKPIAESSKTLIFSNTKIFADKLSFLLEAQDIPTLVLHGDKSQLQRERAINQFKRMQSGVLIATDVAARGLDIKDISYVINFDMPMNFDSYIHRIGRTGRAGKKGESISFITDKDASLAKEIVSLLQDVGQTIPPELLELGAPPPSFKRRGSGFSKGGYGGNSGGGYGGNRGGYGGSRGGYGGNKGGYSKRY